MTRDPVTGAALVFLGQSPIQDTPEALRAVAATVQRARAAGSVEPGGRTVLLVDPMPSMAWGEVVRLLDPIRAASDVAFEFVR